MGTMLPPGSRNWQLIYPNCTEASSVIKSSSSAAALSLEIIVLNLVTLVWLKSDYWTSKSNKVWPTLLHRFLQIWSHQKQQLSVSLCSTNQLQRWVCWTSKMDLGSPTKCDQNRSNVIISLVIPKVAAKLQLKFPKLAWASVFLKWLYKNIYS